MWPNRVVTKTFSTLLRPIELLNAISQFRVNITITNILTIREKSSLISCVNPILSWYFFFPNPEWIRLLALNEMISNLLINQTTFIHQWLLSPVSPKSLTPLHESLPKIHELDKFNCFRTTKRRQKQNYREINQDHFQFRLLKVSQILFCFVLFFLAILGSIVCAAHLSSNSHGGTTRSSRSHARTHPPPPTWETEPRSSRPDTVDGVADASGSRSALSRRYSSRVKPWFIHGNHPGILHHLVVWVKRLRCIRFTGKLKQKQERAEVTSPAWCPFSS